MMVHLKNGKGFTLVELLVSMAIFGLVVGAMASSKFRQRGQHVTQLQAAEMQQSARGALYLMKKDLRSAGFNDLLEDFGAGILMANQTGIQFAAVADSIGNLQTITYTFTDQDLDGDGDIVRAVTLGGVTTTGILAENIQALTFQYFDNTGATLAAAPNVANPGNIRAVQVTVTAGVDAGHRNTLDIADNTRSLTARVTLRNMGLR